MAIARDLFSDKPTTRSLQLLGLVDDDLESLEILCTSFDSQSQLLQKYQESKDILPALESFSQIKVLNGINAWDLFFHFNQSHPQGFHTILWNHPHLGTEDFRLHRFLMAHYFDSVQRMISAHPHSRMVLSLVQGQELRWNLIQEGKKAGFECVSMEIVDESLWPGWVVKRNKTGKSFKNIPTKRHVGTRMQSHFFKFAKRDPNGNECVSLEAVEDALDAIVTKPVEQPLQHSWMKACPECSKVLYSPRAYKQHVHMVHVLQKFGSGWSPNPQKNLVCAHCDRCFATVEDRWQHTVNKHSIVGQVEQGNLKQGRVDLDDAYVACEICGQAVVDQDWGMSLHLESLKPAMGLDMSCTLCHKTFTETRALNQHYKFCRLVK